MSRQPGARGSAALTLKEVLVSQRSLDTALDHNCKHLPTAELSLCKAICFGVLRHYQTLAGAIDRLMDKPIRNKDRDIYALLLIGAYQLSVMRVPEYAAIDSCVNAGKELNKPWACGLINAVLRKFQTAPAAPNLGAQITSEHPPWLYEMISASWPDFAGEIFSANNQEPPFCIRINCRKVSRAAYLARLQAAGFACHVGNFSPVAIYLDDKPKSVLDLPGFAEGECSVQDEAAQLSAFLLDLRPGQRVLDACAAPGGKTSHILETEPALSELVAIDQDPQRLKRVGENLQRLQLRASCQTADILAVSSWWDQQPFDRILCDAPCSGSGVIRRHPDIKLLRRPEDIRQLATTQLAILQALWPTLKPGGILLYATCSILPEENSAVINRFCAMEKSCREITMDANYGIVPDGAAARPGRQLLPQPGGHDGFYYAKLQKQPD